MAKQQTTRDGSTFFEIMQTGLFDSPPAYDAERIRTLRANLGFSQCHLSGWLNVSLKTVQSWEQGTRIPSQASARLLQLIENPHLLDGLRQQSSPPL